MESETFALRSVLSGRTSLKNNVSIWRRPTAWVAFFSLITCLTAQDNSLALESRQANALMAQGKYAEAIPLYKHLVQSVPGNPGLILDLGLAQQMAGHPAEAIPRFEAVLKAQPNNIPALSSLASCRLELNQPRQAIAPLEKLIVLDPSKRDTRGMLAGALMSAERFSEAAEQYRKLTAQNDQDAKAWYGLGSAYEALASSSFARLEKLAPESAYVLELVADSQVSRGQYRSAFFFYRQAESKLAGLRGIHSGLAKTYEQTGHKDWAQQESDRETLLPAPDCTHHASECKMLRGRLLEAAHTPGTQPEDLFWSIKAYNQLALESFEKLGQLPETAEIHALKATLFKEHRQYKQATAEWKAALQLDPGNKEFQRELEASLFLARDYEALVPMLDQDLAADAESAETNFMLGDSLLQLQQPEKAVPYLEKAVRLAPARGAAHASLGLALVQLQRPQEAVPELEKALRVDDNGSLHYQLARAYQATGAVEKAKAAMAQFHQIQDLNQKQDETLSKEAEITAPNE